MERCNPACKDGCQYAKDVGMAPEHSCAHACIYDFFDEDMREMKKEMMKEYEKISNEKQNLDNWLIVIALILFVGSFFIKWLTIPLFLTALVGTIRILRGLKK